MIIDREIQRRANAIARAAGHGKATEIVFTGQNAVISHTPYGWRKYSTGQYVGNTYRTKFGWKNTYYQHAETVVSV